MEHSKLAAPSKFQSGDLVGRLETSDDFSIDDCYHLYRISEVPLGHKDAASRSVDTYPPSAQICPVKLFGKMISEYASGSFNPDTIRRPKPRRMVAAEEKLTWCTARA